MSSNVSGIPAAAASPDALVRHVIQYAATGPDGTETVGLATVTGTAHTIPWSQLAGIPGFQHGTTLQPKTGDRSAWLLGPAAHEIPGHGTWCVDHQNDLGDGTWLCWGEKATFGAKPWEAFVQLNQNGSTPATVWFDVDGPDQGEYMTPVQARERAQELRAIAGQLDALAAQAEATEAVTGVSA